MKKYPLLGSYVPMTKPDGYLVGSLQTAIAEGANTFMFYTGAPQNTTRVPISELNVPVFEERIKDSPIALEDVAIHAPYVVNLANSVKPTTFNFGIDFLKKELKRASEIGVGIVVVHPGASVGASLEDSLNQLVKGLNAVIKEKPRGVKIALETMAGKGTEVGKNFEELAYLINHVDDPSELGVCIDTCHLYDSGYDIKNNWVGVRDEFFTKIGKEKLFCMHLNDSKFGFLSHKDRHANIGYGEIGFESLLQIVNDEEIKDVPKYLETPFIGKIAPYKYEITMLKKGKFHDFIREINPENLEFLSLTNEE